MEPIILYFAAGAEELFQVVILHVGTRGQPREFMKYAAPESLSKKFWLLHQPVTGPTNWYFKESLQRIKKPWHRSQSTGQKQDDGKKLTAKLGVSRP